MMCDAKQSVVKGTDGKASCTHDFPIRHAPSRPTG